MAVREHNAKLLEYTLKKHSRLAENAIHARANELNSKNYKNSAKQLVQNFKLSTSSLFTYRNKMPFTIRIRLIRIEIEQIFAVVHHLIKEKDILKHYDTEAKYQKKLNALATWTLFWHKKKGSEMAEMYKSATTKLDSLRTSFLEEESSAILASASSPP